MNRIILSVLFVPVVTISTTHLEAQATNSLLGKWSIEYERGRRMENGETTMLMGSGTVVVSQSGDSLLATIDPAPRTEDGSDPPPAVVGGHMTAAGAVFPQKQTVQINMNGDVQTREITLTWTLKADGDVLTGTLGRVLPGMPETPPTPVKGKRVADK